MSLNNINILKRADKNDAEAFQAYIDSVGGPDKMGELDRVEALLMMENTLLNPNGPYAARYEYPDRFYEMSTKRRRGLKHLLGLSKDPLPNDYKKLIRELERLKPEDLMISIYPSYFYGSEPEEEIKQTSKSNLGKLKTAFILFSK